MTTTLTIGRRVVPLDHVALVEPFVPSEGAPLQSAREFRARLQLIFRRESLLIEESVEAFAATHGFRLLTEDGLALNPKVRFRVETFRPTEDFAPEKPYTTRLIWRDGEGGPDSHKLLLSPPEMVLAVAVMGGEEGKPAARPATRTPPRRRRRSGATGPTAE